MTGEEDQAPWIEQQIQHDARTVEYPPTPDLRGSTMARVAAPEPANHGRRLAIALGSVAVVLLAGAAMAIPATRDAAADFLGLAVPGERIDVVKSPTAGAGATPRSIYGAAAERASIDELLQSLAFELLKSGEHVVSSWLVDVEGNRMAILRYTDYDLWQGELRGQFVKGVPAADDVETVRVRGQDGYWVTSGERPVRFENAAGTPVPELQRTVAANALLWSEDGIYYRIETERGLEDALRIADGLAPMEPE